MKFLLSKKVLKLLLKKIDKKSKHPEPQIPL